MRRTLMGVVAAAALAAAVVMTLGLASGADAARTTPVTRSELLTTQRVASAAIKRARTAIHTVRVVKGSPAFVPNGDLGVATADCAAGEVVTGGGFEQPRPTSSSSPIVQVVYAGPDTGAPSTTWRVDGYLPPGPANSTLTAIAYCAKP